MRLNQNEKSAFEALWQLIILADIKLTQTSLKNALLQHNDFPTFASFGDVLDEFNIPNLSTRLSAENLSEIPLPALAHLEENDGDNFVIIKSVADNQIEWQQERKIVQENITEFTKKWEGITLLIEPDLTSGEANFLTMRRKEVINNLRTPFIITGILLCLGGVLLSIFERFSLAENWQYSALLLTKILGVVSSVLLVWYSIDGSNPLLENICHLNKKTNCENILNSKAARIFGWLSWSEIGLFYFSGGFSLLLLNPDFSLWYLGGFTLLALPYTFWSVYYQAFVAKEWCPLCLSVQVLLWAEAGIFFSTTHAEFNLQNLPFRSLIIAFLPMPILWAFVKNPLLKSYQSELYKNQFQKLKFSPDFIENLMSKEIYLPIIDVDMKVIKMGNPLAENKLTLVINPVCGGCKRTFGMVDKLIENQENINCEVILVASADPESESSRVTQKIFNEPSNEFMLKALRAWFAEDKVIKNSILAHYPAEINTIAQHRQWYDKTGFSSVPLVFMNNTEIPSLYSPDEYPKLFKQCLNVGFRNQQ
jgi:uncharacterized membrane protein